MASWVEAGPGSRLTHRDAVFELAGVQPGPVVDDEFA
jgi:hypothetical protein